MIYILTCRDKANLVFIHHHWSLKGEADVIDFIQKILPKPPIKIEETVPIIVPTPILVARAKNKLLLSPLTEEKQKFLNLILKHKNKENKIKMGTNIYCKNA